MHKVVPFLISGHILLYNVKVWQALNLANWLLVFIDEI